MGLPTPPRLEEKFYLSNSNTSGIGDIPAFASGNTTDILVAGNWDGQPLMLPPTPAASPTAVTTLAE